MSRVDRQQARQVVALQAETLVKTLRMPARKIEKEQATLTAVEHQDSFMLLKPQSVIGTKGLTSWMNLSLVHTLAMLQTKETR